jgi:hypothetical protein
MMTPRGQWDRAVFSCQAAIEDAAMMLALSTFVNYGEGIVAPTLLPVVMILARGFVLSGALLAPLSICGLAGHTPDRLVGVACWTRCSRTGAGDEVTEQYTAHSYPSSHYPQVRGTGPSRTECLICLCSRARLRYQIKKRFYGSGNLIRNSNGCKYRNNLR